MTSPDAKSCETWKRQISFVSRPAPAPKLHRHRILLPRAASGPGVSLLALAYASVLAVAKPLLLIVGRYFARQIKRQDPVAILPTKNLEYQILAMLQF